MVEEYRVGWSRAATKSLSKLFNVDYKSVFTKSTFLLSTDPRKKAYGVTDYSGFNYNGYYWVLINNVVIVYKVSDEQRRVFIEACCYANTEESAQVFWGIEPDEE